MYLDLNTFQESSPSTVAIEQQQHEYSKEHRELPFDPELVKHMNTGLNSCIPSFQAKGLIQSDSQTLQTKPYITVIRACSDKQNGSSNLSELIEEKCHLINVGINIGEEIKAMDKDKADKNKLDSFNSIKKCQKDLDINGKMKEADAWKSFNSFRLHFGDYQSSKKEKDQKREEAKEEVSLLDKSFLSAKNQFSKDDERIKKPSLLSNFKNDDKVVGKGGQGSVFRFEGGAFLKRRRVMKTYSKKIKINFLREAEVVKKMSCGIFHPEFPSDSEHYGIVINAGVASLQDFKNFLKRTNKALTPWQFKALAYELLRQLQDLFWTGFCHRDIKPQNIVLTPYDLAPVFIDYGLVACISPIDQSLKLAGTYGYIDPHMLYTWAKKDSFTDIDLALSDYFSLGLTLMQMAIPNFSLKERRLVQMKIMHDRILYEELVVNSTLQLSEQIEAIAETHPIAAHLIRKLLFPEREKIQTTKQLRVYIDEMVECAEKIAMEAEESGTYPLGRRDALPLSEALSECWPEFYEYLLAENKISELDWPAKRVRASGNGWSEIDFDRYLYDYNNGIDTDESIHEDHNNKFLSQPSVDSSLSTWKESGIEQSCSRSDNEDHPLGSLQRLGGPDLLGEILSEETMFFNSNTSVDNEKIQQQQQQQEKLLSITFKDSKQTDQNLEDNERSEERRSSQSIRGAGSQSMIKDKRPIYEDSKFIKVQKILKQGPQGFVCTLEDDSSLKKMRVVKIYDKGKKTEYLREAEALRKISQRVLDPVSLNSKEYYGLVIDAGISDLRDFKLFLKETRRTLTTQHFLEFTCEMLRLLKKLVWTGFCHRNIKPRNIVLTAYTLSPVLIDYGLTTRISSVDDSVKLGGSEGYIDPYIVKKGECFTGIDLVLADYYAVGISLLEIAVLDFTPRSNSISKEKLKDIVKDHPACVGLLFEKLLFPLREEILIFDQLKIHIYDLMEYAEMITTDAGKVEGEPSNRDFCNSKSKSLATYWYEFYDYLIVEDKIDDSDWSVSGMNTLESN